MKLGELTFRQAAELCREYRGCGRCSRGCPMLEACFLPPGIFNLEAVLETDLEEGGTQCRKLQPAG